MSGPAEAAPEHDDLLTARGVTSDVKGHGHALLLDYDDAHRDMMRKAIHLPGVTVVLESSPGKWHAYNLTVRDLESTVLEHLRCKADATHAQIGLRRGRLTMRWGPKTDANASAGGEWDEDSDEVPQYRDYWVNATEKPQSEAHLSLLSSRIPDDDLGMLYDRARNRCPNWVAGPFRRSEYLTYD